MVFKHTTYRCGKCPAWYNSYREAEACELRHVTQAAVEDAQEEIATAIRSRIPETDNGR